MVLLHDLYSATNISVGRDCGGPRMLIFDWITSLLYGEG